MTKQVESNWYADTFKAWPVKLVGPKPTDEMLANVHKLGLRPGKQALANAMALRDCGVTNGQIVIACGAPQLNKMRDLITDAFVKRVAVPRSANGHTVYKLELTAKGKQRIARTEAALAKAEAAGAGDADKPAKAPAKRKGAARVKAAPKGAAPQTPTTVPAIEPGAASPVDGAGNVTTADG